MNEQAMVKHITRRVVRSLKASPGTYRQIGMLWDDLYRRMASINNNMSHDRIYAGSDRRSDEQFALIHTTMPAAAAVSMELRGGREPVASSVITVGQTLRSLLANINPGDLYARQVSALRQANTQYNTLNRMLHIAGGRID